MPLRIRAELCDEIVHRLEPPSLGELEGDAGAARRRDHQPQLPRPLRRRRRRCADAGQGHRRCSGSTAAPSGGERAAPPRSGSRRAVVAMLDDPPCLVTAFVEGAADDGRGAARAGGARARSRARCARCTIAPSRSPRSFASFRIVENYARDAASAAPRCPAPTRGARKRPRDGSRRRCAAPSTSRSPATTTSSPPTSSARRAALRIVDWEYAGMGDRYFDLGNFAVNNELGADDRGGAARRLLRASRRPAAGSPRCG